jgi:hypothetical protein
MANPSTSDRPHADKGMVSGMAGASHRRVRSKGPGTGRTKFLMLGPSAVRVKNWVLNGPSCLDLRVGCETREKFTIDGDRTEVQGAWLHFG